jgi:subtilisin family serine protease
MQTLLQWPLSLILADSSFSQYGATSVDIGAPGSGIWSTVPARSKGKNISGYASYNGTSMATHMFQGRLVCFFKSWGNSCTN